MEEQFGQLGGSWVVITTTFIEEGALEGLVGVARGGVVSTCLPEGFESRGEAPRLSDELPGEAEGVGVGGQVEGFEGRDLAEIPRGEHQGLLVLMDPQGLDLLSGVEAPSEGDGVPGGLDRVLGDVVRHSVDVGVEVVEINEGELRSPRDDSALDAAELDGSDRLGESLAEYFGCLLYTSPSPRDRQKSRMPSSA